MSEKRKPTYDLGAIKTWAGSSSFQATGSATRTAIALGFTSSDMIDVIVSIRREHFYKSMTSFADHRVWQDVYHVPSLVGPLYVKFQKDVAAEFLLLSFKEKDDG